MILADVNVLLKAYRTDAQDHARCRQWLNAVIDGEAEFGVSQLVLSAVIRIATNRRVYNPASETVHVVAFCDSLLDQPHCVVVEPGPRHWSIFSGLCRLPGIKAGLITDAWFAALAIEHGCEWITLDGDFARFPELRWRAPAA